MDSRDMSFRMLTEVIDSIGDGAAVFGADDRLIHFNRGYVQYFQLVRDILKPGTSFAQLFEALSLRGLYEGPDEGLEEWIEARVKLFAEGVKGNEFQRADGRWVRVDYHKLKSGGTFVLTADITERKELKAALQRIKNQ